jgi:hypothetical protein
MGNIMICTKCNTKNGSRAGFCKKCHNRLRKDCISLSAWCRNNNKAILLKEWSKNNNFKPSQISARSHQEVLWVCSKCGYEWKSSLGNRTKGQGCPLCLGARLLIGFNDLETCYPEIAKEWNYEKNKLKPNEICGGSITKVWWKCKLGHEWKTTPNSRTRGRGCPYCCNKKSLKGFNDITTTNPELLDEWYDDRLPTDFTFGSDAKIKWKCSKCQHIWITQVKTRTICKNGCPKCNQSHGERLVGQILDKYNIKYEKQQTFDKCKYKRCLPFDFYLEQYNVLIEFQGIHHYKNRYLNSIFVFNHRYSNEELDLTAKKDKIKQNFCYRNKIKLIRIPYYRMNKIEEILVKKLNLALQIAS